jgi:putative mRNA 3-end processing factor
MPKKSLLEFTDKGIYRAQGKFYIDPWQPVDDAVITHAYPGNKNYLAHHLSKEVLLLIFIKLH